MPNTERIAIQEMLCGYKYICNNGSRTPYPLSTDTSSNNLNHSWCSKCPDLHWKTLKVLPSNLMQILKNVRMICVNYTHKCNSGIVNEEPLQGGQPNTVAEYCFSCNHMRITNG